MAGAALAIRPGRVTQDGRHYQRQRAVTGGFPGVVPVRAAARQPRRPYERQSENVWPPAHAQHEFYAAVAPGDDARLRKISVNVGGLGRPAVPSASCSGEPASLLIIGARTLPWLLTVPQPLGPAVYQASELHLCPNHPQPYVHIVILAAQKAAKRHK